eukprot:CAMPEP_0184647880 /NCGR_PEP_ID=MMETSP0308-20130426/4905_1 /TAXON_ID=38269 /ORGANISM="Gloeochaete witrockiana, Strain SAG 46.84" /LENGTH=98 /DNA_ID=CAMNT_0027079263 /DNA_START=1143 /DNA_END=1439 /DNA_ORIENTATION=-
MTFFERLSAFVLRAESASLRQTAYASRSEVLRVSVQLFRVSDLWSRLSGHSDLWSRLSGHLSSGTATKFLAPPAMSDLKLPQDFFRLALILPPRQENQ